MTYFFALFTMFHATLLSLPSVLCHAAARRLLSVLRFSMAEVGQALHQQPTNLSLSLIIPI